MTTSRDPKSRLFVISKVIPSSGLQYGFIIQLGREGSDGFVSWAGLAAGHAVSPYSWSYAKWTDQLYDT
jgi:hypothetical protein